MTARAAVAAILEAAPQVAVDPVWQPPSLLAGERLEEYLAVNAARIDEPGSRVDTVMVSSSPLLAPDADGSSAPVDTTLVPAVGGWQPENTTVETVVGSTVSKGIALGDGSDQLLVYPGGRAGATGVLVGNKIVYGNSDVDADTIVEATPTGVSVAWAARSVMAPESYSLRFALPAGVTLRQHGPEVLLMKGAMQVGRVAAPTASDAQGSVVPVSYSIQGADVVRVNIDHRVKDVAYPIGIDPVIDYYGVPVLLDPGSAVDTSPLTAGWSFWSSGSNLTPAIQGPQFQIFRHPSVAGGQGWWWAVPPRASYITRAEFANASHGDNGTLLLAGLYNAGNSQNPWAETGYGAAYRSGTSWSAPSVFGADPSMAQSWIVTCVDVGCSPGYGTTYNSAGFMLVANQNSAGSADGWAQFGGGYLFLRDHNDPTFSWINGLPTGWSQKATQVASVRFGDAGLGIGNAGLQVQNLSSPSQWWYAGGQPCDGTTTNRCPDTVDTTVTPILPDGRNILRFTAYDLIGRTASSDKTVLVDTAAPALQLGGRLAAARNRAISSTMRLEVAGDDSGPGGRETSQTSSVSLRVGGALVQSKTQTAQRVALDPYDFDPSTRPLGPVEFRVNATDTAGNSKEEVFNITVARGLIPTLSEGRRTAKRLLLQAEDLKPGSSPAGQVRFQYRRSLTAAWDWVPTGDLRAIDGQAVSNPAVAMQTQGSQRLSSTLVWNVAQTIGTATTDPIYVRGVFDASNGVDGNTTEDVLMMFDASGLDTDDATTSIDPGDVDLLTGNFSLSDTDVDIDSFKSDLTITRTYNSRNLAATVNGPFGPGWTLGTPVVAAGATYLRVTEYGQSTPDPDDDSYGFATIATSDGGELVFEQADTGNGYYSEPGLEYLQLVREVDSGGSITAFVLTDRDSGDVMRFEGQSGGKPGVYELKSVVQPTSSSTTTFSYEPASGGGLRVTRMLAPVATGVSCTSPTTVGCRSLRLEWNAAGRLARVWLTAAGHGLPGNEVAVAEYAYDANNRLVDAWDPRITPALKTTYTYAAASSLLATVKPPGENAWQLEYQATSQDGSDGGRLKRVKRVTPVSAPGTPDVTATQTLQFGVQVSGGGAPYDMSVGQLAAWSQTDRELPVDAAAVFRPDDVPSDPATNFTKARVHYLDGLGRRVNLARPGEEIDTWEYDKASHVIRELTAANRARALQSGSTTAEHATKSQELDTQRTYVENSTGWRMTDERGPLHQVRLASGTTVQARKHTRIDYDEGKPDSTIYNLPTTTRISALVGGVDQDERATTTDYQWNLRLPTVTTVDPTGLNLKTVTQYDSQGLVVKQRLPRSPTTDGASTHETLYYTAAANPADPACGSKPEWVNLPCKIRSAAQATSTLPKLPVAVFQYNAYYQPTDIKEYVDGVLRRTTTTMYDAAGREISEAIVGSGSGVGIDLPTSTTEYSTTTGAVSAIKTPSTTPVRAISKTYDAVGRLSTYTDADGAITTTRYDALGRPTRVTDSGGGDRSISYDATTGRVIRYHGRLSRRGRRHSHHSDGWLTNRHNRGDRRDRPDQPAVGRHHRDHQARHHRCRA